MKITIDVTKLLDEGKITKKEYDRLLSFSAQSTSTLAINILAAFGIVAVGGGTIALAPSLHFVLILSLLFTALGLWTLKSYGKTWKMLGSILTVIGVLGISGTAIGYFPDETSVFLFIALILFITSVVANSGLLAALSAVAIAPIIHVGTGYSHASYFLFVEQPILTVLIYGILTGLTIFLAKRVSKYERSFSLFSIMSMVMTNFGLWVGSLWGDKWINRTLLLEYFKIPQEDPSYWDTFYRLSEYTRIGFSAIWAVLLVLAAIWGVRNNKRYMVNTAAIFGAIHFYTQWFERLGLEPVSILVSGVLAIVIALVLWKYNRHK